MRSNRIRVGILCGGRSCEHEVSLQSARGVMGAIDSDKYEVIPIGVAKDGRWRLLHEPIPSGPMPQLPAGEPVLLPADPTVGGLLKPASGEVVPLDVVFPLIHGPQGEDGTVQGLFELAGIAYVGAGVAGSAAGMDKALMKALFQQAGLPVAPYRVVSRARWQAEPAAVQQECEDALVYPWFVKPANMGSSVGVVKVHGPDEFAAAMQEAARYDSKLLVEEGVQDAHEIEVAVLGNDTLQASVAGEILPCHEFYDYSAKYLANASELIIPAPLPETVTEQVRTLALGAFQALDCAGLARIDFLVRRADHAVFLLEANTLPGFTPISMYPKLWQASGVSYSELIDRLIQLALARQQDRGRNQTSYLG